MNMSVFSENETAKQEVDELMKHRNRNENRIVLQMKLEYQSNRLFVFLNNKKNERKLQKAEKNKIKGP